MPCRTGMTGCKRSCLHRAFVREYATERARQEAVLDAASLGYETERADLIVRHPELRPVTFRDWLLQTAGRSGFEEELAS